MSLGRRAVPFLICLTAAPAAPASAQSIDPSVGTRVIVGSSGAPAPMSGLDGARTQHTPLAFPTRGHVLWRTRVEAPIRHGITVDRDGTVSIAHSAARLTAIGPNGAVVTSTRLGGSDVAGAVVLASDSTRVVVTTSAVFGVRRDGGVRFRLPIPPLRKTTPPPLGVEDGSVVVAEEHRLIWIERDGTVRASVVTPERLVSLVMDGASLLALTESGSILEYLPSGLLSMRGSFGGSVSGALLRAPHRVVALVADSRLMEYDLVGGQPRVLFDAGNGLYGPMALGADGGIWVVVKNELREFSAVGRETRTVPLGNGIAPAPHDGALVVDGGGRVAFAASGSDLVVSTPSGELHRVDGSACDEIAALVPAGDRRLVIACSSGLVAAVGE